MPNTNDSTPPESIGDERAGVRQVLNQQLLLHEIAHHSLQAAEQHQRTVVTPRAHELMDIYKCLHQGEFGVEHNIGNPEGFTGRLRQEMNSCGPEKPETEPVLESIHENAQVLRVNLRPLIRLMNGDMGTIVSQLTEVCLESAHATRGKADIFKKKLIAFHDLNQAGELRIGGHAFVFPQPAVERFLFEVRQLALQINRVPVFSHSEIYRQLNRPAYRVVDRSVLEASPLKMLVKHIRARGGEQPQI